MQENIKESPFKFSRNNSYKKGYINACALREIRERYNYNGKAVLIMDNYGPHKISLENIDLINGNVIVHFLPHSSDQVQPLDTQIFGIMKRYMNNFKNDPNIPIPYIEHVYHQTVKCFLVHRN